jgi:hypothetical protein
LGRGRVWEEEEFGKRKKDRRREEKYSPGKSS